VDEQQLTRSRTRVAGFEDRELDFQLLRQLGVANYGGASVGETLAAAAHIRAQGAGSWTSVFAALGERQRDDAERRARAGHNVSASGLLLTACNSFRAAEYFAAIGSARHRELGQASQQAFTRSLDLSEVAYERIEVELDSLHLPGYWFGTAGRESRGPIERDSSPILVATSGFDGTLEETYLQVGRAATERGWQLVLIAGPGQADTARSHPDAAFVPDTERWISPWLDVALRRPQVDPDRLALLGISFGGYFVLRAAAADARVAAVVANSPIVDLRAYMTSFVGMDPEQAISEEEDFGLEDIDEIPDREMPPPIKEMSRSLIRRFGQPTFLATFAYLRQFKVDPAAVSCASLAMVGEGEGAEPIAQFERFAAEASGAVTRRMFTSQEGADGHCQLGNLPLSNAVLFDWLDETLAATATE
jgi:pimeloyl-ACP methyl ester carboxylesterase